MILLIDNYDSYTFNLAHLIAEAAGREPLVVPAGEGADLPQRVRAGERLTSELDALAVVPVLVHGDGTSLSREDVVRRSARG